MPRTRRSRFSARTSTASTPTARSGWRVSATTPTTRSAGGASSRSATTTTSRTRRPPASWPSSARSAARSSSGIWPPLGEEDYTSYIAQIPDDIDGFYLSVGGTGTLAFVKQYTQLKGDLADKIIGGSIAIDPSVLADPDVGPRMAGVVSGSSTNEDSTTPEYTQYVETLTNSWPDSSDELIVPVGKGLFGANWANGAEAIAHALESVNGDLSDGGAAFREALTAFGDDGFESVEGPITLDENRNAIGNNYIIQATAAGRRHARQQDAEDDRGRRPDVRRQLQRRHADSRPREPGVRPVAAARSTVGGCRVAASRS